LIVPFLQTMPEAEADIFSCPRCILLWGTKVGWMGMLPIKKCNCFGNIKIEGQRATSICPWFEVLWKLLLLFNLLAKCNCHWSIIQKYNYSFSLCLLNWRGALM